MRESNFAFPAQNRACVCITSQLYDRRALDTNASLPLFNSLTHLTYLTSTSPRIREIMTMDGGLERLVKLLHDFCICPPPPDNPALLYGLAPPNTHPPRLPPTLIPKSFDKHAAYRFSLAFQSVVNIGVRGSESIRGRVVQAGTLDVVGCILEAWLASKGFAVGPGATMPGMQRETREQRQAKKQAVIEAKQREQAVQLQRALQRQADRSMADTLRAAGILQEDDSMDVDTNLSEGQPGSRDTDTSTEPSSNATPAGSNTPTGAVIVPGRDRSGTIIARPVWDQTPSNSIGGHSRRTPRSTRIPVPSTSEGPSTSHSTDTSRPETETEDDGDVDMDHDGRESDVPASGASSPERQNPSPERQSTIRASAAHPRGHARRAVGIVSDAAPATADLGGDAHIIINDQGNAVDGVGGVEDGIVSLEANDDFAMGAPPGAPGAINGPPARAEMHGHGHGHGGAGERTPRAGTITLPAAPPVPVPALPTTAALRMRHTEGGGVTELQRARLRAAGGATPAATVPATVLGVGVGVGVTNHHRSGHHRDGETGPYRDEDVLLALQLLAYLSKYPHVRQAFYKPRAAFHPATVLQAQQREKEREAQGQGQSPSQGQDQSKGQQVKGVGVDIAEEPWWALAGTSTNGKEKEREGGLFGKAPSTRAGANGNANVSGNGKDRDREKAGVSSLAASTSSGANGLAGATTSASTSRMTNVFALVERFTYRPSTAEVEGPSPPPTLPPEIQYWASVIMRNACRKDDSRGGIRQCANMMCGKWESYPREFAKCRRCRKAKYCGKECQSIAWSEGHRFWCSAKDPEDDPEHQADSSSRTTPGGSAIATAGSSNATGAGTATTATTTTTAGGTVIVRPDRRTRVVAEFAPRIVMNPSPLAQVAETVRQGPLNLDTGGRRDQGTATATATQWAFNPLGARRMRPRVDDAGEQDRERRPMMALPSPTTTHPSLSMNTNAGSHHGHGHGHAHGRRTDSAVTIRPVDVELSPEVRRHLVQIIDGTRRAERIETTPDTVPVDVTVAGPSRIRDPAESDNDEPMVIG